MEHLSVLARVDRLERENRALRWIAGLGLVVLGFLACSSPGSGVLRAESFVLVDEDGTVRGEWGPVGQDGREGSISVTCLRMRDSKGELGLQACGPWDQEGAASILIAHSGGARVSFGADGGAAAIRVGPRRTEDEPRPPHVGISASSENATVAVTTGGPQAATLTLDSLTMRDDTGHVFVRIPESTRQREGAQPVFRADEAFLNLEASEVA